MVFWSQHRPCSFSPSLPSPNVEHGSFVEKFFFLIPEKNPPCVSSLAAFVTHKCHFQSVHLQFLDPQLWAAITAIIIPTPTVPAHPAAPQGLSLNSTWSRSHIYPPPKMSLCCSCCVHFQFAAGVGSEPQGLVLAAGNMTLGLSVHIHDMGEATLLEQL